MKTMDIWGTIRVHNSHMLVRLYAEETGEKGVYLSKSVNDGSRMSMGTLHGVYVFRPGFKTNAESKNWLDHGNKSFSMFSHGYDWATTMAAAEEWARAKYGVGEFGPIRGFGSDRFPAEVIAWAKTKFKELSS